MCGIAGLIRFDEANIPAERLKVAAATLKTRGPDSSGFWSDSIAHLAHTRLSIIDLSSAGHQPMISNGERFVIVFNGEIYNYSELRSELSADGVQWRSTSDTEVILVAFAKWGSECISRFRGMFSIAIWDREQKRLFLARDRLGVKPLYVYSHGTTFAFASRPSALLALLDRESLDVDLQGLRYYLEAGYYPGNHSYYERVRKVTPGSFVLVTSASVVETRYWSLHSYYNQASVRSTSESDLITELDRLVVSAVRSRLVSDVPVGAFLSGGIDSTLVVAIAAKYSDARLSTFTIGFEEAKHDESEHALSIARHLGTLHHTFTLKANDLLELLPTFFDHYDEPLFDAAAFPTLALARLAAPHIKVALSGDGGDELFGGYHYYQIVQKLTSVYAAPPCIRRAVGATLKAVGTHNAVLVGHALRQSSIDQVFPYIRSIQKDFPSILTPDVLSGTKSFKSFYAENLLGYKMGKLLPTQRAMLFDSQFTLPDDYLQKIDVATMAYSIEARDPLLDQHLAEWAASLPLKWKTRGRGKYLLRELAYRYAPRKMLDRPKHGFTVPIDKWLRGPLKQWAEERLNDSQIYSRVPLRKDRLLELFALHCSEKRNASPLLWAALVLMEFVIRNDRQQHSIDVGLDATTPVFSSAALTI